MLLLTLLSLAILSDGCDPGKHNPNVTLDPHCDCDASDFGVVQTVPYCAASACGTMHVDLSSACVRCSMCVAVAEKINQTLLEVHEMISNWLNDTEITLLLRTICDHSFQHLRNLCHEYLDEIQELQLYESWKGWCDENEHLPDLENVLCR
ncbi:hypothetical protein DMN91_002622 [Ooceraea biroi]|uniref:Saposin B-type domain-containing protein n=1 Tax=Ooceraea biroi TaxID=2015173 RepID=A0A3L8DWC0_OOCBI|nr:hypothetical protein DMN91_002622 [Ooceraea biroi]